MIQTANHQSDFEQQLLTLTKMIAEEHIRSEAHAKATHERFNIFTTLLRESDEVRLHTRFLHCLLDPDGCHDCGSLFLDLFFETLNEIPGVDDSDAQKLLEMPNATGKWSVRKEVSCPPHGQIDLLIEKPGLKIAIENKINAAERPRQLADYSEFLRKRSGDQSSLIYLTKDGKKSTTHERAPYIRISYANHILPWLEKCLRESYQKPPIIQGLLQYQEVVRQITGKTLQSKAMKPIAEFVGKNPDIIRHRKLIIEATDEACASFLDDLAVGLINEFRNKFAITARVRGSGRFGKEQWGDIILTLPPTSILYSEPYKVWIEHDIYSKSLFVGIVVQTEKLEMLPLSEAQKTTLNQMFELLKHNSSYSGESNTVWPTGWHDLIEGMDDDKMATLMQTPIQEVASDVCGKVSDYIKVLENVYSEVKQGKPT